MARVDTNPEDRDREPLVLSALVDCESCETTYDAYFHFPSGVYEREDIIDAPIETVTCPSCGHQQDEQWPGWTAHADAG